jgi:GDP-D-mannose 3',5'-epimerase
MLSRDSHDKQIHADVLALKEKDAYPARPEDGYGWESLFSERMCRHFEEDFGLQTRVARYQKYLWAARKLCGKP